MQLGTLLTMCVTVVLVAACSPQDQDKVPEQPRAEEQTQRPADSSAVAIAVISLDPQGWNDIRAFINDLPKPSSVSVFYGNGNVLTGDNVRAITLLDSLVSTRSLRKSDAPATLPYFSTALSSAIGSSLRSSCVHTRTVVLGTFPPLLLKSRAEFERVGPIITRTELDALTQLPDHKFIVIGPSGESVLRDMLLRAFEEAKSNVTSISYGTGAQR